MLIFYTFIEVFESLIFNETEKFNNKLRISIKIKSDCENESNNQAWCQVKIHILETKLENLDIETLFSGPYLTQLTSKLFKDFSGTHVTAELPCGNSKRLSLKMQYDEQGEIHLQKTLTDDLKSDLVFTFRDYQNITAIEDQTHSINNYLHVIKIFHLQLKLLFELNMNGSKIQDDYNIGSAQSSFGKFRMNTSLRNFLKLKDNICQLNGKIMPRLGKKFSTPFCDSRGNFLTNLSWMAISALVPTPHPHSLDFQCDTLQICLLGPLNVPIRPCSEINFENILNLEAFGYTFGEKQQFSRTESDSFCPDFSYKLLPNCNINVEGTKHIILVFIKIDVAIPSVMEEARLFIEVLDILRKQTSNTFVSNGSKISSAVNNVLSKILPDQVKKKKAQMVFDKNIPLITDSIMSVVRRSTNEEFKNNIYRHLQVNSSYGAESSLANQLWDIAVSKHKVNKPNIGTKTRTNKKEITSKRFSEHSPTSSNSPFLYTNYKTAKVNSTENQTPELSLKRKAFDNKLISNQESVLSCTVTKQPFLLSDPISLNSTEILQTKDNFAEKQRMKAKKDSQLSLEEILNRDIIDTNVVCLQNDDFEELNSALISPLVSPRVECSQAVKTPELGEWKDDIQW